MEAICLPLPIAKKTSVVLLSIDPRAKLPVLDEVGSDWLSDPVPSLDRHYLRLYEEHLREQRDDARTLLMKHPI
jgi:hypothetical protein